MIGVMMHPNPYDYSDYDEVWETCPKCKGKGWKLSALPSNLKFLVKYEKYGEVPF